MQNNQVVAATSEPRFRMDDSPIAEDAGLIAIELMSSFCQVVAELGGDALAYLEEAGIDPQRLRETGGKLSLRVCGELLERTAERLACPDLGLRLAEHQDGPALMRPVDRLLCSAPTLHAVLIHCTAHMDEFASGIRVSFEQHAAHQMHFLRIEVLMDRLAAFPQLIEQLTLLAHNGAISLTAGEARGRRIWFSHSRIGRAVSYAQRFKTTVEFGQAFDGVFFSENDCATKVAHSDTSVFAAESRKFGDRPDLQQPAFEEQVRIAIRRALSESECHRKQVASLLRLNTRTLQRRLCKMGLRFEQIRDEVRRGLAFRYLAQTDLCVTDIAGRLGYSEPAVLTRSCRRWFAATPRELRRSLTRRAVIVTPNMLCNLGSVVRGRSSKPATPGGMYRAFASS
jgi:AraC-like DNA-binding protein